MLKEKTFGFKFIMVLDRVLNVLTGGSFQEFLSTRAYIKSELSTSKYWHKLRNAIDAIFYKGHCRDSFEYEMQIKKDWRDKYINLL